MFWIGLCGMVVSAQSAPLDGKAGDRKDSQRDHGPVFKDGREDTVELSTHATLGKENPFIVLVETVSRRAEEDLFP
jgi:hypothetical protein